jgi:integrase/recombinase XerD
MPSLYEANGHRKYLTAEERDRFLKAAEKAERDVRTFCGVLAYTGCRISEALALTADRIDLAAGVIVFESLKKRKNGVYRAVPVPPTLLDALDLVHGIRKAQARKDKGAGLTLWPWARNTAWRHVKAVMEAAGLTDPASATPKGLRHAFADAAISKDIPLNLLQRWLGHA